MDLVILCLDAAHSDDNGDDNGDGINADDDNVDDGNADDNVDNPQSASIKPR